MKKNKKQLNQVEKIFDNNKFNNVDFEIFVNKTKSFAFIKNDIDRVLNNENCTEENLALIEAYGDAAKSRGNTISIFVALASFGISTLSLAYNSIKITDSDIKFFKIIAFLIAIMAAYGVYYVFTKKAEKMQFAYSYLINLMEIKLEENKVEKFRK